MLDCEVTGSGVVNYRMSAEFMVDASRLDGSYEPMLATEWGITPDGRTWNFKLRQGVSWQHGWGEFTADDVVHSLNYYTNPECRASYSDYFRSDPGSEVEVINDYEINIHMQLRPAVDFLYWFSGYRGFPSAAGPSGIRLAPTGRRITGRPRPGRRWGTASRAETRFMRTRRARAPTNSVAFRKARAGCGNGWTTTTGG